MKTYERFEYKFLTADESLSNYIYWDDGPNRIIEDAQNIYFHSQRKLAFGHCLYVTGSIPELGSWNIRNAVRL